MKYVWTTITVNDMDQSLKFYEEIVGLPLHSRNSAGPQTEIAFLGSGDTEVELICHSNVKIENRGTGISLGFQVESVDETMKMMKEKGITITKDVIKPNPHIKFFFVNDPNGVEIQFAEKI